MISRFFFVNKKQIKLQNKSRLPESRTRIYSTDEVSSLIAKYKKKAKRDPLKYCNTSIHELDEPSIQKQSACS